MNLFQMPAYTRGVLVSSGVRTSLGRFYARRDRSRTKPACDENLMCDGIKNLDATRALLSVPLGRGCLTRFQRCWRYGAARRLDLAPQQRETRNSRRTGRRDDVAVVPADAKSIATSPVWRNPERRVPPRRLPRLRTLCRRCLIGLRGWVRGFRSAVVRGSGWNGAAVTAET